MARADATDTAKDTDRKAVIIMVREKTMGMENVITTENDMALRAAITVKDTDPVTARDTTEALAEREYSA